MFMSQNQLKWILGFTFHIYNISTDLLLGFRPVKN